MYLIFTHKSPLECKEIQPVHSEGDQAWEFFGRTDVEAETPVLWPPDVKSWLIWKGPDSGKDWGHGERGTTEDEMVGWHHQLNGHGFGWSLGVGDGQGGQVCCSSWDHKESGMTQRLNWTELKTGWHTRVTQGRVAEWADGCEDSRNLGPSWASDHIRLVDSPFPPEGTEKTSHLCLVVTEQKLLLLRQEPSPAQEVLRAPFMSLFLRL